MFLRLLHAGSFCVILSFSGGMVLSATTSVPPAPGWDFTFSLMKTLTSDKNENLVFSPYSIRLALGSLALGAKGKTLKQLGKPAEPLVLRKEAQYKFLVANRLWIQSGTSLLDSYLTASDNAYGVRPWIVDFSKAPDFLMDRIHGWISEKTLGKIRTLLTENMIDPQTKMMLVSSAVLKAPWAFPFEPSLTQEGKFYSAKGDTQKTKFVRKTGSFHYRKEGDYQLLEIPFIEGDLGLLLILPESKRSFESFISSSRSESWEEAVQKLEIKEVNLTLPKIEFQSWVEVGTAMKALGITDAFQADLADFSSMTGNKDLVLNRFDHKAWIGFSEEGTEGGSVSEPVSTGGSRSPSSSSIAFHADRPFYFLIRHRATNVILLMGKVAQVP